MKASPFAILILLAAFGLRADQIEMQNGDRYIGKVLSMDTNTLLLRSEMLGTMKLPRNRIANITLGTAPTTSVAAVPTATNASAISVPTSLNTNAPTDLSSAIRQLNASSNLIQQVQSEYLGAAGPEANQKFNEMMTGLLSGQINASDLRSQARSAADQLKELKSDLGDEEVGPALDVYLSVLENFLKETEPSGVPKADFSVTSPKSQPKSSEKK